MSPELQRYLIPLLIIVPILLFRMRTMSRKRRLKLGMLWLRPGALLVVCTAVIVLPRVLHAPGQPLQPFGMLDLAVIAAAIALGAVPGWYMGRTMKIDVHPEDGTLMVQSSPIGLLVILGLVVLRMGVRAGAGYEAQALHLNLGLIFEGLIVFSTTVFTVRSLEMYLRAKKVMRDHLNEAFS
jgi:hypothetical protein